MATTEPDQVVSVPEAERSGLDRYFKISDRGSSVKIEILAGVTTWLTMAYILFLNPAILGTVPDVQGTTLAFPQVLTVTALAAGMASASLAASESIAARSSAPASLPTSTRNRWPPSSSSSVRARSKPPRAFGPVSIETQKQVFPAFEQLTATMKASRRRAS